MQIALEFEWSHGGAAQVPRIYEPYIPLNENYGVVKFTPSINELSINFRSGSFQYTCTEEVNSSPMSRRPSFDVIRDSVRDLLGMRIDKLARHFAATHDMKVKEEIERLAKEYGKLKEPWRLVAR